jgi:hypothetical protein
MEYSRQKKRNLGTRKSESFGPNEWGDLAQNKVNLALPPVRHAATIPSLRDSTRSIRLPPPPLPPAPSPPPYAPPLPPSSAAPPWRPVLPKLLRRRPRSRGPTRRIDLRHRFAGNFARPQGGHGPATSARRTGGDVHDLLARRGDLAVEGDEARPRTVPPPPSTTGCAPRPASSCSWPSRILQVRPPSPPPRQGRLPFFSEKKPIQRFRLQPSSGDPALIHSCPKKRSCHALY